MLGTFRKSFRTRSIQRVVQEKPLNRDPYPPTTVSLFTKPFRPLRSAMTTRIQPPDEINRLIIAESCFKRVMVPAAPGTGPGAPWNRKVTDPIAQQYHLPDPYRD